MRPGDCNATPCGCNQGHGCRRAPDHVGPHVFVCDFVLEVPDVVVVPGIGEAGPKAAPARVMSADEAQAIRDATARQKAEESHARVRQLVEDVSRLSADQRRELALVLVPQLPPAREED